MSTQLAMNDLGQLSILSLPVANPASVAPPAVGVTNVQGTGTDYARSDHTHSSSVQRKRVVTAVNGTYTWTFNPPYAAGVIPVVSYGVEGPSGSNLPYVVNITAVSNLSVSFQVFRSMTTTLGATLAALLGLVISPFTAVTNSVTLHCWAANPTS